MNKQNSKSQQKATAS